LAVEKNELLEIKEFYQNEVFMGTTLHPGNKIGGLVFLPILQSVRNFILIIPLNSTDHVHCFVQSRR